MASSILHQAAALFGGLDNIDPREWNNMSFFERVCAYDWTKEMYIGATLLVYILVYMWGRWTNAKRVSKWMTGAEPALREEFAEVGCSPNEKIIRDSPSRFTTYASGRVNVEAVLVRFHTVDRHNVILDIAGTFWPALRSIDGDPDEVVMKIVPTDPKALGEPVGVFAVLSKMNMQRTREENWFLKHASLVESGSELPDDLALMREHSEAQRFITPEFMEAVKNAHDIIEMFAITDLPRGEPTVESHLQATPRVWLVTKYPTSVAQEKALAALVKSAVRVVDVAVTAPKLSPAAARKIKAFRDIEISKLRQVAENEAREKAEQAKVDARRKELSSLNDKEQAKLAKREQEKRAKKQRRSMNRRG